MPARVRAGCAHDKKVREEAKSRYQAGEPISRIATAMGVSRMTLHRWREEEGWVLDTPVTLEHVTHNTVMRAAQEKVLQLATYQVVEQAVNDGTIQEIADLTVAVTQKHLTLAHLMNQAVLQFREDVATREMSALEILGFRTFIWGAAQAIESGRAAAGRKQGEASVETAYDPSRGIELAVQTLEPRHVSTNADGRALEDAP